MDDRRATESAGCVLWTRVCSCPFRGKPRLATVGGVVSVGVGRRRRIALLDSAAAASLPFHRTSHKRIGDTIDSANQDDPTPSTLPFASSPSFDRQTLDLKNIPFTHAMDRANERSVMEREKCESRSRFCARAPPLSRTELGERDEPKLFLDSKKLTFGPLAAPINPHALHQTQRGSRPSCSTTARSRRGRRSPSTSTSTCWCGFSAASTRARARSPAAARTTERAPASLALVSHPLKNTRAPNQHKQQK